MTDQEIRQKYPKCYAKLKEQDNYGGKPTFQNLTDFFESLGVTIALVPSPLKRRIEYAPVIMYCFDINKVLFLDCNEWQEVHYTQYETYRPFLSIFQKDEAIKKAIEKAFSLIEGKFETFLHYA